jgi:branched-chain amino acid transport system permease protein
MAGTIVQLFVDGISMGIVYVIMAAGFNLIMSVEKILFLAFADFYMLAAFFLWYLMVPAHVNFALGLIIATVGCGLLGAVVYATTFRWIQFKEGQFLTNLLLSVAWMLIILQAALQLFGTSARGIPSVFPGILHFGGMSISLEKAVVIVVGIAVLLALHFFLQKSRTGRAMRAISIDSDVAALQGVNAVRLFTITMALGCALAGFAGAMLAPVFAVSTSAANQAFLIPLVVLLGGLGSMLGSIIAGLLFGMVLSYGQYFVGGGEAQILFFVVVAIVLVIRPGGILGQRIEDLPL